MKYPSEGLSRDLRTLQALDRRRMLQLVAGAGLLPFSGGCSSPYTGPPITRGASSGLPASCPEVPEETAGPYPGDGTNGPNALATMGVVRSDIRGSFGNMKGVATGVPLTINLTLVNANQGCALLSGYAIYLWHCDRDGKYSLYTLPTENYLRGVMATDGNGLATFQTVFPGCYAGRYPHVHFEVFPNLNQASVGSNNSRVSQFAFPKATCDEVYASAGYGASLNNMARTSLTSDMAFEDGPNLQLPNMSGSLTAGLVADLILAV
jgi:protocatechuate 3,4-dioxygenase beta subunit